MNASVHMCEKISKNKRKESGK